MNIAQIQRMAAFQADKVKQAGTITPFITQEELDTWVNDANAEAERLVRMGNPEADFFDRTLSSLSDTTALKINGISYTPSVAMLVSAGVAGAAGGSGTKISLPPDFQKLRNIRCPDTGFFDMRFEYMDIAGRQFQEQLRRIDTVSPTTGVFYDIIADRTLWMVPALNTAINLEITYVAATKPLVQYSTGTVAVTDATAAVVGTNTVWVGSGTQFDQDYLDIMWGASGVAALPTTATNLNYDDVKLSRVKTILTDTTLTLATNKAGTLAAGTGYVLASLPVLPRPFHHALVDYVTAQILDKAKDKVSQIYLGRFASRINSIVSATMRRQDADTETVEDYMPGEEW